MTDLPAQLDDLQREGMELLLIVRRQAARVESLTERARLTSTLFHRSQSTTDSFARRAAGLQERASNASVALSARKTQALRLAERIEALTFHAGDERLPEIERTKKDLAEVKSLLQTYATDPLPASDEGEGHPNEKNFFRRRPSAPPRVFIGTIWRKFPGDMTMAKRGRKSVPTPILKLRHTFRPGRHAGRPTCEVFDQRMPTRPLWLIRKAKNDDAEVVRIAAKQAWERLSPQLFKAGLLVDAFRMMFTMLVDSWGRYCLACQKCDAEGMTVTGAKDNEVKSPWTRLRAEFLDEVTKLAANFGLTPADLSSVRSLEKPTIDAGKSRFFGSRDGA